MIDPKSKTPFYIQLKRAILREIRDRDIQRGELIPSENELRKSYGLSIRTIRKALLELEKDGIVYRRQGRGTFLQRIDSSLSDKKDVKIGVLFSNIEYISHPYLSTILKGVENVYNRLGYSLNLYVMGNRIDKQDKELKSLQKLIPIGEICGVIIASPVRKEDISFLRKTGIPLVTFNKYEGMNINCILADYFSATQLAIQHLVHLGHRRISIITGPFKKKNEPVILVSVALLKAYKETLLEHNLEYNEELIKESNYKEEEGIRLAEELLSLSDRPTAIFAADDILAQGVIKAAKQKGLVVPEDLAVVGCNDSFSDSLITSVRVPLFKIGELAAKMLYKLINHIKADKPMVMVKPELIIRQSSDFVRE